MDAIVVGREGQWRIINDGGKSNDERGGGGAAVAAAIPAAFVLDRVCLCSLLLSSRRTCVDLPSFLDRFLAAAEFVRRITDDGF